MAGRGLPLTRALWSLAAVCFCLLLGGLIVKETLSVSGCTGPRRVEADAFARDLTGKGRVAAANHVASFVPSIAQTLPSLPRATPDEVRLIVATGLRDSPSCRLFVPEARAIRPAPGLCYGYQLPPRLAFPLGGLGIQNEFAVTVACDHGHRWRINGFI